MHCTSYSLGIFVRLCLVIEMERHQQNPLLVGNELNEGQNNSRSTTDYGAASRRIKICENSQCSKEILPPLRTCHPLKTIPQYSKRIRLASEEVCSESIIKQPCSKQENDPKTDILSIKRYKETKESVKEHFPRVDDIDNKARTAHQLFTQLFNKDSDGDTILHLAIIHNDQIKTKSLVQLMSEKTLDIYNKLRQTPLHLSVLTCQPTMVRLLVSYGANVNVSDRNGQTPLHLASKNADIDSVKAIKEGTELRKRYQGITCEEAKCNIKNFQGQAAMHLAVLSGSCEIAKILLTMNANINIQDGTSGRTPLHLAVEAHNINMVQFLLQNNADVNACTFSGNTALHTASGRHMDQLVRILIQHGANINITNIEGDTPFYFKNSIRARREGNKKHKSKLK